MVCGSPSMLADTRALLDSRGFVVSPNIGTPGHYVFERAFVEECIHVEIRPARP